MMNATCIQSRSFLVRGESRFYRDPSRSATRRPFHPSSSPAPSSPNPFCENEPKLFAPFFMFNRLENNNLHQSLVKNHPDKANPNPSGLWTVDCGPWGLARDPLREVTRSYAKLRLIKRNDKNHANPFEPFLHPMMRRELTRLHLPRKNLGRELTHIDV